jgi:zinc transport system substrate-binding protein
MKRLILVLLAAALFLTGCAGASGIPASNEGNTGKLKIVTSFYPMYDFTMKIGGDRVETQNLAPSGVEPHEWEPSAADIVKVGQADIFIYNGMGMESWAEKVLASAQNKNLTAVTASDGISAQDGGGASDPHVWLNPAYAKTELQNIKNALSKADPKNAEYYTANFEKYASELDKLNGEYRQTLSSCSKKDIVVAHAAFGCLCSAYGLNQVAIEGLMAESEPDALRMAEIVDFVRKNGVKVIFSEELISPKVAQAIAAETGAVNDILNPLEGLSDKELAAGADYFSVMRQNLKALKNALE